MNMNNLLKPLLGMLEIAIPSAEPENEQAKFVQALILEYIPEDLPKDIILNFSMDTINKHPDEFDAKLRELYILILQYFNRKTKDTTAL